MRQRFIRWLIKVILPGYCLSRIGKKGTRKHRESKDAASQPSII